MGRVPNLGRVPTEPGNFWSRRSRKATIALIVLGRLDRVCRDRCLQLELRGGQRTEVQ